MNKEKLEKHIKSGKSTREIASIEGISQTNVRYWAKKFGLRFLERHAYEKNGISRICTRCKLEKPLSEYYVKKKNRTGRNATHATCKRCFNDNCITRQQDIKRELVQQKGGKCCVCGYDRYFGALSFHHLDPAKKDFEISRINRSATDPDLQAEMRKCVLLCLVCHTELHGGIISLDEYIGRQSGI